MTSDFILSEAEPPAGGSAELNVPLESCITDLQGAELMAHLYWASTGAPCRVSSARFGRAP